MGTTTKIIFGSALALSIALMFLIFSMQKSAQLTLDIEDVNHTVQKKELMIAEIQQNLEKTQAAVESAKAESAVIPGLKDSIASAEQEKLTYIQQVDKLHGQLKEADAKLHVQLKEADAHLTAYDQLQEEFKSHQLLLADTEKAKLSADMQTAQTVESLQALQEEMGQREEQINQSIVNLEQKDRVVLVYKEKLNKAIDEISLLKENDSTERLNLNLILDDLAVKTHIVKKLTLKVIELDDSADLSGTDSAPAGSENGASQTDEQAVFEHLTLENNTLTATVNEQGILIQDLNKEFQSQTDLLVTAEAALEQLQTAAQSIKEELNALHLTDQHNQQELTQLRTSLTNKENEFIAIQEHALELAVPLREKIILLEEQVAEATATNTSSLAELDQAVTSLTDLQQENEQLSATLSSTQSSLEETQKLQAQLENDLQTTQSALQEEQTARQSLSTEIEPITLALAKSEEQYVERNNQYQELAKQLATVNEEKEQHSGQVQSLQSQLSQQADLSAELTTVQASLKEAQEQNTLAITNSDTLKTERDTLLSTVSEKDTAIQNLTTQLSELQAALTLAQGQQVNEEELAAQEQRIAQLIEEVATAKSLAEAQATTLQTTENELGDLKASSAANNTLEEDNKRLEATLNENQERLNALEAELSIIKEERDQLLLYTVDSDNDGISDASDQCADTVAKALVNAQGCEADNDQDGTVNRLDLCPETAAGLDTDNAGCSSAQTTVVLKGISFQLGTSELTENALSALSHAAVILKINPAINMEVAGHTDSIGDPDSNLRLSTSRAQAVLNYLVAQGVAEDRLVAKGYGSSEPIADNTTNAGRALNRRVELRKIQEGTTQPPEEQESVE